MFSSDHDQFGLERAGLFQRLENGDEIAGGRAERVHRLDDIVERDAGREQEHVAAALLDLDAAVGHDPGLAIGERPRRSEEHTSELQSLMRISYAVFCLKKKNTSDIIRI